MSATVMSGGKTIGHGYSAQDILTSIEYVFGKGDQAHFTLEVDGQESIIVREAMRRYCETPSKSEEIMAAMTPEGCEYTGTDVIRVDGYDAEGDEVVSVRVYFRRIAPPVEYRWEAEEHERTVKVGDWVWIRGLGWREVFAENVANFNGTVQLCARRVEVKR